MRFPARPSVDAARKWRLKVVSLRAANSHIQSARGAGPAGPKQAGRARFSPSCLNMPDNVFVDIAALKARLARAAAEGWVMPSPADCEAWRGADTAKRRRRERKRVCQQERGTIEQATAIMGVPQRTVQALAARGDLPGAAKFGRVWTFDLARLRRHVKDKEKETWRTGNLRPDAIGAATPSGAGLRSMGATSDGRFTRATRRLRERAARLGKIG